MKYEHELGLGDFIDTIIRIVFFFAIGWLILEGLEWVLTDIN